MVPGAKAIRVPVEGLTVAMVLSLTLQLVIDFASTASPLPSKATIMKLRCWP